MNDKKKNRPRGRPRVSGVCKLSKAVTVKFSKIDYERLCRRSRQANLTLAEFLRISAFETMITARHSAEETAVIRSLTGMANNLNQLTRRVHETGRIYDADLEDISRRQEALWDGVHQVLTQLAKLS